MGSGFLGIGGWEFLILLIVFVVIVGPQRLPEYTRNIVRGVRRVRTWVDESRETVENEMGIAVDDLRKYDPRQYDPRRIIREAWGDTSLEDLVPDAKSLAPAAVAAGGSRASGSSSSSSGSSSAGDSAGPARAPYDPEAT